MSSIPAQYVVDNEQNEGVYKRHNSKGNLTGLVVVKRRILEDVITEVPEYDIGKVDSDDEIETREIDIAENNGSRAFKKTPLEEIQSLYEEEWLETEIIVPHVSREGKYKLRDATPGQGLVMKIDYITLDDFHEKYKLFLDPNEKFTSTNNRKVARIRLIGISPEYSGIKTLAKVDKILGFPDYQAEKTFTKPEKTKKAEKN